MEKEQEQIEEFRKTCRDFINKVAEGKGSARDAAVALCKEYAFYADKGILRIYLDTVYHDTLEQYTDEVIEKAEDAINKAIEIRGYSPLEIKMHSVDSRRRYLNEHD